MTRLQHWLFTLRAALSDDYAKLASGGGQPFPGGIPVYPLSSCREFWVFRDPPLSLGLSWRDPGRAGGFPPAPPQSRTSPIKAYGSSRHGFAAFPSAIRGVLGTGTATSECRACCSRTVPLPPTAPFPTPRLLGSRSPAFHRYYEAVKTPTALLPSLCSSHCAGIPWVGLAVLLREAGKPAASRPGCC